jgi:hypothetical protein
VDGLFHRSAQHRPGLAGGLIAIGLALAGLGGCVATTTSPGPSASEGSPESSLPVLTATPTFETPELPTASPETTPYVTTGPTMLPSTGPLPSLGPVIPGRWTGLRWIAGPTSPELAKNPTDPLDTVSIDFSVFSWSGGYVGFRSCSGEDLPSGGLSSFSITAETSPDGLRWTRLGTLELPHDPMYSYPMAITDVVEGPAGLLAMARIALPVLGGTPVEAIWTSADGRSWQLLNVAEAFGECPHECPWTIDAGSAGYIATGYMSPHEGNPQLIWTSADGRAWHRSDVSGSSLENVQTRDATAFAGGYVLAGEIFSQEDDADYFILTPALWWSADGETWSRDALPGSTPSILRANVLPYPDWDATIELHRIGDHALVAMQSSEDEQSRTQAQAAWTSTDGRHWTLMRGVDLSYAHVESNGQRAVVAHPLVADASHGIVEAFEDDLGLAVLRQTGTPPSNCWEAALGPTGLVVVDSTNHRFVVGVPTGG